MLEGIREKKLGTLWVGIIFMMVMIQSVRLQTCIEDTMTEVWYTGTLNSTYSTDCYVINANLTDPQNYFLRILTIPQDFSSDYVESICTEIPSAGYMECVSDANVDGSDLICANSTDVIMEDGLIYVNVLCVGVNCPINESVGYQVYFGWVSGKLESPEDCNTSGIPVPMGKDGVIFWTGVMVSILVLLFVGAAISGFILYRMQKKNKVTVVNDYYENIEH